MTKSDLSKKASYANMQRLRNILNNQDSLEMAEDTSKLQDETKKQLELEHEEALERAGKEPTTNSEALENRNGYNADFLDGWHIPLPTLVNGQAKEIRQLRRGGEGAELKYQNFSVVMSASRRMPLITAVNINGSQSIKIKRGKDVWCFDGRLEKEDQWGDIIYANNPLDRGHMVRREDPIWGDFADAANRDTFHFTNCCPQIASVNQKTWLGLEDHILQNARVEGMHVTVFTGPFFSDDDYNYRFKDINGEEREVPIPLSFWKVVAIVTEEGRPSATAYKVSQEEELSELEVRVFGEYKNYQISIQQVIDETGIDFSALADYDGFTQFEKDNNKRIEVNLEAANEIRI